MSPSKHETVVIERKFKHDIEKVFAALKDPRARESWSPPSKEVTLIFDTSEFKVGGRDVSRCLAGGEEQAQVEGRYLDIVEPGGDFARIIYSETVAAGDMRLFTSLVTLELTPTGAGSSLALTVQIASLIDPSVIDEARSAWELAATNLEKYLAAA